MRDLMGTEYFEKLTAFLYNQSFKFCYRKKKINQEVLAPTMTAPAVPVLLKLESTKCAADNQLTSRMKPKTTNSQTLKETKYPTFSHTQKKEQKKFCNLRQVLCYPLLFLRRHPPDRVNNEGLGKLHSKRAVPYSIL